MARDPARSLRWTLPFACAALAACGSTSSSGAPGAPSDAGTSPALDAGAPDASSNDASPDDASSGDADAAPPAPDGGSACGAPQAGGALNAIALAGTTAYVVAGPHLAIWDVSDPRAPTLRGETPPFDGMLGGVAVVGTHAYVVETIQSATSSTGYVHVVDVADPSAPVTGASIQIGAGGSLVTLSSVAASATSLFVADSESGITVLDLADPAHPASPKVLARAGVSALQVVGTRLYWSIRSLLDPASVTVGAYDLSAQLADLGSASLPDDALSASFNGANLAVTVGAGGAHVYDLTNLASPKKLFDASYATRAAAIGDGAALVPADDGVHVLDLSKPGTVTDRGVVKAASKGANAAAFQGALAAIVTDRGRLVTFDATTPAAPALAAVVEASVSGDGADVARIGARLVLADRAGGLRLASAGALTALARSDDGDTFVDFEDVTVADHYAYVADWAFGLRVFDVAGSGAPQPVAQLAGGSPSSVVVEGTRLYLGQTSNGGNVSVVDVADPTKPALLGSTATPQVWKMRVRDQIAYVACEGGLDTGGLYVYDAKDPKALAPLGSYLDCHSAVAIALSGGHLALACDDGLHLLDVTNAAAPTRVGKWAHATSSGNVSVEWVGTRAYFADDSGITTLDVSDLAAPKEIARRTTAWGASGMFVGADGCLVAACGPAGVYQMPTR